MPGGVGYDESGPPMDTTHQPAQGSRLAPPGEQGQGVPDDLSLPAEAEQPPAEMPPNGASHYSPPRHPVFLRNATRPNNPQHAPAVGQQQPGQSGLIGPVGYDVP